MVVSRQSLFLEQEQYSAENGQHHKMCRVCSQAKDGRTHGQNAHNSLRHDTRRRVNQSAADEENQRDRGNIDQEQTEMNRMKWFVQRST